VTETIFDSQAPTQALATRAEGELATIPASLLPIPVMRQVLSEYVDRRTEFRKWLLSQLKEGVHYGVPPGCEQRRDGNGNVIVDGKIVYPDQWQFNPSLYKAGADFICDLIQMDPQFSPDLDTWKMLGSKEGTVVICCKLLCRGDNPFFPTRPKLDVLGEGRGAGVAGVKRRDGNGAVKIAQKSAKIDAVINTLGLSDLFTQDLEDTAPPSPQPAANPASPKVATRAERQQVPSTPEAVGMEVKLNQLYQLWRKKFNAPAGSKDGFADWACGVLHTTNDLTKVTAWTLDSVEACSQALAQ
jgi:hypothetical protein